MPVNFGADLKHRTLSALVLVPVVLLAAYLGGIPFAILWVLAGGAILYEWATLARLDNRSLYLGVGGLALMCGGVLAVSDAPAYAFSAVAFGAAASALAVPRQSAWAMTGLVVAGSAALPVVILRGETPLGLIAVLFLCAVVWATDIFAYFTGRALGGPKLWPRVSPNKTWSGAIGGTLAGMAAGVLVAAIPGGAALLPVAGLALGLSIISQAGDLAESALKRLFGVKDASRLIPGHGGLLDRLDGFAAASLAAVVVALLRSASDPAAGLLLW
ncbi:UNVERIFIED_ORG: phosphatidate cytidylyltransferase [Xanthobacter viscosus]|jgi:phosphatidate cytidylyltransferase|uniref:Phosphatidate cytidylyltransferase n=1 Tax=Xanthobacter autotrophicus TaxID=280 RepID=A0A6C1KIA4_XANAU|nr:phosphatidate cytidylyltransferase [Xanthobacter autotrophicus]TLX43531.1 phosphatidate cytidylyltransferase [Xanthobacter autotrophicus]